MTNNKANKFSKKQQQFAEYGKILSHPARVAIIELLAEHKEIKTGNISDFLPISRTTVSQHLKELRKAGVIKGTIDGLKIHYCLDLEKLNLIRRELNELFENATSYFECEC